MGVIKVQSGKTVEIVREDNRDITASNVVHRDISVSNTRGPRGLPGPTGPTGPQGDPPPTFIFEQGVASDEWTITHNLDNYPSVTVVDSAGSVVIGDVFYVSNAQIILEFDAPFAGKAYLN